MKAAPLLVAWHEDNQPVYSAQFEPHGKGRLATAGGDMNVRIWRVESEGEERKVTYLSTLKKHTQAVNVVRWCPKGELLASAGDDGNVLLWQPSDNPVTSFGGEDGTEDVEHWRVKTMCRSSSGSEIYDLAWSPCGTYFVTGSMDNVARIYKAENGSCVRQIAEHNHYVQGVAWDPLNEFVATQSSDRSVHIYTLRSKDGQFSLDQHNKVAKMDLPGRRRVSSNSPAPPDLGGGRASFVSEAMGSIGSPRPSAPGTPQSLAPMNPPPTSHSRRSSFGSQAGLGRQRSVSPSPSMPLPAVMPSASPSLSGSLSMGIRNTNIYANETFTSFFRRLTFAPDGSLLFTPAGQFKTSHPLGHDGSKTQDDIINTVYIYTRAGLNKPPVAYLPGHKKPSIAVKCSPVYYHIRSANVDTKEMTIGTDEDIPPLPEPAVPTNARPPTSHASMDPPPLSAPSPSQQAATMASPRHPQDPEQSPSTPGLPAGPPPAFGLPYRIVYAVATQDAVHVYDTQQQKPLCVVSNLHYATFTDLTWSSDGQTLLMTSSDGFCSALTFAPGELGNIYNHPVSHPRHTPQPISITKANSAASTPQATPTLTPAVPVMPTQPSHGSRHPSVSGNMDAPPNPSASPFTASARPASPARSMSTSSIGTEASSLAKAPDQNAAIINNPTPSMSAVPSLAAGGSNPAPGGVPLFTPPQTPGVHVVATASTNGTTVPPTVQSVAGMKRESASDAEEGGAGKEKKRRITSTLVSGDGAPPPRPAPTPTGEHAAAGGGGR